MDTENTSKAHVGRVAIRNLSILLGRTYHETKETHEYLERAKKESNTNSGLFNIIYKLGKSTGR